MHLERTNALALGSGPTLLGVLRSLSETGAQVVALPDVDHITRRSRWYRPADKSFTGLTPESLATRLELLPSGTVLMPCSDIWVRSVAALPEESRRRWPACAAALSALDVLVDKGHFGATLDRLGLPRPSTRAITSTKEVDEISDRELEYSFLKPVDSQQFFARFGVKAFRITDRANAREKLREAVDAGLELVLQEYVPGPPTNHYHIDGFVDRKGVVRALFARQRLRMSPPDFGNDTLMVSVPLSETGDSCSNLDTLFSDIGYRGIFSAEVKRDERDGRFKLIEINARPWWYVEFATRCGVNVCELALRDALGEQVQTISSYAVGRRCVYPYYDREAALTEWSAGRLSLSSWARSWLGAYQPIFRWSDPLPAGAEIGSLLLGRIRRGRRTQSKHMPSSPQEPAKAS